MQAKGKCQVRGRTLSLCREPIEEGLLWRRQDWGTGGTSNRKVPQRCTLFSKVRCVRHNLSLLCLGCFVLFLIALLRQHFNTPQYTTD